MILRRAFVKFTILTFLLMVMIQVIAVSAQGETYEIPPDPEGMDADQVVARVGDEELTLAEFRSRVRYERFYYYYFIESLTDQYGPQILDLEDPTNQLGGFIANLVDNLASGKEFAEPILNIMVRERLYQQEAENRGVEVEQCDIDRYWALLLSQQDSFVDCQLPEGFEELREAFLERAERYSGRTAEQVTQSIVNRAQFDAVREAIGDEIEVPDVDTVQTRHIRVADEETANEVIQRLEAGEDFQELMLEYTLDFGAPGDGGDLGTIRRGTIISGLGVAVPELEEALFSAEVGEIVGPVESELGYHVAEVTDQSSRIHVRHILFDNEEDANTAVNLLNNGSDFAELARTYSNDPGSRNNGGDLGFLERGQAVPTFEEAAFNAEIGEIVGPVQTDFGYHVLEVLEIADEPATVTARHILVETEEEAQDVLNRLSESEDFAALAYELSLDPEAGGHRGDTLTVVSRSIEEGFYVAGETRPEFDEVVFDSEVGEILGPIATTLGGGETFLVVQVLDKGTRPADMITVDNQREQYVVAWEEEQFDSDRIEVFDNWLGFIPDDPLPSAVTPQLTILDDVLAESKVRYAEFLEENSIMNRLRNLKLPEPPAVDEGE